MQTLFSVRIPFPMYTRTIRSTGKIANSLCTINNIPVWYRWVGAKIKTQFKQDLEDMYVPEPKEQYESLTIHYRIIRDSKKRIDADSAAMILKWFQDHLEATGYVKDDKHVNVQSFPTVIDSAQSETMIEIRVQAGSADWDKQEQ